MLKNKCVICEKECSGKTCSKNCSTSSCIITKSKKIKVYLLDLKYYLKKHNSENALKHYRYSKQFIRFLINVEIPLISFIDEYIYVLNRIENMSIDLIVFKNKLILIL